MNPTQDRHRVEFSGGSDATGKGALYPHVVCGSGADVFVSAITGGLIWGDAGETTKPNLMAGPVLVDCSRHGQFQAFVQVLPRGSDTGVDGNLVSMPLMLVPLKDIEYVLPESMR